MTTIIVVAIVALVFFVTLSVVAFMVWKREAEIRTDSMKAMERSINDVVYELAGINARNIRRGRGMYAEPYDDETDMHKQSDAGRKYHSDVGGTIKNKKDPFGWVKSDHEEVDTVKVFKPAEEPRKVRWTEVSEEDIPAVPKEETHIRGSDQPVEPQEIAAEPDNEPKTEISLSFVDLDDLDSIEDIEFFDSLKKAGNTDYNTGRSGRKYTAEELESLIKE